MNERQLLLFERQVLLAKLEDLETPGFVGDFDPDEAELVGAFREDALSEQDALESTADALPLFDEAWL